MKRIIEICSKNAPQGMQNDIVKLRLRGKGSGFKEGQDKRNPGSRFICAYHPGSSINTRLHVTWPRSYYSMYTRNIKNTVRN